VTGDYELKITDFGLSREVDNITHESTVGTFAVRASSPTPPWLCTRPRARPHSPIQARPSPLVHRCVCADSGGKSQWMAPEVIVHANTPPAHVAKMDVWSYGVVLWELLTRQIPYDHLPPFAVAYGVGHGDLRVRHALRAHPRLTHLTGMSCLNLRWVPARFPLSLSPSVSLCVCGSCRQTWTWCRPFSAP
jgi:serine/threonine protein kinase